MQRLIVAGLLLLACGCTRVDPGYVGIKVNMYGDEKGVEDLPLQTGRVWYNVFTESIYEYPTFMQSQAWAGDEAISFNSIEGSVITADVGLNYSIESKLVPHLFIEFRQDIDSITHGYLRNQVRDAFGRVAGKYKAVDLFGEKKQELLEGVRHDLQAKLAPKGFLIDTVSFNSSPVADPRVMASINSVIEANQRAIEAESKVKQVQAEAEQEVAKATGKAEAILAEARAQAEANKLLTESITPALIQYRMLEKWDGVAPKVFGADSGLNLMMGVE